MDVWGKFKGFDLNFENTQYLTKTQSLFSRTFPKLVWWSLKESTQLTIIVDLVCIENLPQSIIYGAIRLKLVIVIRLNTFTKSA